MAAHSEVAYGGRVFSQSVTPLGSALPIYTATGIGTLTGAISGLPLWNPSGSGANAVIRRISIARASGTTDFGAIGLMYRAVNQSAVATGSQITVFGNTTPVNGFLGGGQASLMNTTNGTTVTIVAGVASEWNRTLFSMNLEADSATAHPVVPAEIKFEGEIIVRPGSLVWIAATKASVALMASTIVWEEQDQ